jgi:hypothetical protein
MSYTVNFSIPLPSTPTPSFFLFPSILVRDRSIPPPHVLVHFTTPILSSVAPQKYAPPVSALWPPSSRRSSSSPRRGFYKFAAEIFTSCVALLSSLLGSNHAGRIDRSVESRLHRVRPGRWRAKRLWGGSVRTLGLRVMPLWGLEAKSCEGGEWVAPPIVRRASLPRTPGEVEE